MDRATEQVARVFLLSALHPLTALISSKTGPVRQKFTIRAHEIFKGCCQREAIPDMLPPKASSLCPWHAGEVATPAFHKWFVFDARQKERLRRDPLLSPRLTEQTLAQRPKSFVERNHKKSGNMFFFPFTVINKDEPRHQLPATAKRCSSNVPVKPKKGLKHCGQSSVPQSVRTSLQCHICNLLDVSRSSSGPQKNGPETGPADLQLH